MPIKTKNKFVQTSIESDLHERLKVMREASGMSMYRILAFALLEWEHKHATIDSLMGKALADLDKKDNKNGPNNSSK
jgi:hypothetical protein